MDKSDEFPKVIEGQSERFSVAAAFEYPPLAAAMGSVAAHHTIMFKTQTYLPSVTSYSIKSANQHSSSLEQAPLAAISQAISLIAPKKVVIFDHDEIEP